ncbi:MAG: ribosome hibernation-promoting factor, HPF/YfiA family [Anaerolineae bacterium]
MELHISSHSIQVTEYLEEYIEKKIGKLDRYLPDIAEARVDLSTENTRSAGELQVAQVTLRANGKYIRAEERSHDIFACIDTVLDKLYRQIARYKGKREDRWRGRRVPQPEPLPIELEMEEEEEGTIVRRKQFQMFPMDEREAIEQMELLGHTFFVFHNADTGEINVVYRRKDGDYGLIVPVLA